MSVFKKLAHRAKQSISDTLDPESSEAESRKEWRAVNKTLKSVGNNMSTKLYSTPVPLRLCKVCAKIDQTRSGWSGSEAVRCPAQLLNPQNECQMCKFFGRYLTVTREPEIAALLPQCEQPVRLCGMVWLDNIFILNLYDPEGKYPERDSESHQWTLRSTMRGQEEADIRAEFESMGTAMGQMFQKVPETRIMGPQEASSGVIDVNLIRSWLYDCDGHHECIHPFEDQQFVSSPLYLIDASTRQVVHVPSDSRYIILSYVWGGVVLDETTDPFVADDGHLTLPDSVPQTIEDAITLTRTLGERYLWVDRYCCDQHDEDRKMAQIMEMDRIFANAYLTLVTTSSTTMYDGIAGVSRIPGLRQFFCSERKEGFVATLFSKSAKIVDDSLWNKRGWCFQEEMLSKRILCFSDQQYWLKCRRREYSSIQAEEANVEIDPGTETDPRFLWPRLLTTRQALGRKARGMNRQSDDYEERQYDVFDYFNMVKSFLRRDLTYQSDRLNAFLGLSARTGLMLRTNMQQGMPYNESFHSSLCFTFTDSHFFSINFPSWSWLGWHGNPDWMPIARSCDFSNDPYFGRDHTVHLRELRRDGDHRAADQASQEHQRAVEIMNSKPALWYDPKYIQRQAEICTTDLENTLSVKTEMATLRCQSQGTHLQIVVGTKVFDWSSYTTKEFKSLQKDRKVTILDSLARVDYKRIGLIPGQMVIPEFLDPTSSDDESEEADSNDEEEGSEEDDDDNESEGQEEEGEREGEEDDEDEGNDDTTSSASSEFYNHPSTFLTPLPSNPDISTAEFILIQSTHAIGLNGVRHPRTGKMLYGGWFEDPMVWALLVVETKQSKEATNEDEVSNRIKTYRRVSVLRIPREIWMAAGPKEVELNLC